MNASAATSLRTAPRDEPSASFRAASIPCVSGTPWASVLIQPGRSCSGTFTPQKTSRKPKKRFEDTAVSRKRSPMAAFRSPSPVHAKAVTAITSASEPTAPTGTWIPSRIPPIVKANAETRIPFAITGSDRPR